MSIVLYTLNISRTCYWRRDEQVVTVTAIQFHLPSIDAWNSWRSVCAWFSWSPSRSRQPWNTQSTNIRFHVIGSFIFFDCRLWVHTVLIRMERNDVKNYFILKCILKRKILWLRNLVVFLNEQRYTSTRSKSIVPNPKNASFNFIPTKAMTLSCKDKFQRFGVIIWRQVIIKRDMKH